MLSAAIGLSLAGLKTPAERLADHMASLPQLKVGFSVEIEGVRNLGGGTAEFVRPGKMRLTRLEGTTITEQMVQTERGILAMLPPSRLYSEYGPFPVLMIPPEELENLQPSAPVPIMIFFLKSVPTKDWKVLSPDAKTGLDRVEVTVPYGTGMVSYIASIDAYGFPVKTQIRRESPGGGVTIYAHSFRPLGAVTTPITFDRPRGYSWLKAPDGNRPTFEYVEQPLGTWRNARTGQTEDVKASSKGKPLVVVFTSPQDPLSTSLESHLVAARTEVEKLDGRMIEVSLGPDKPNLEGKESARTIFHDADGKIEGAFDVPYTPFVLVLDREGIGVDGWGGFDARGPDAFLKLLRFALRKANENQGE